MMASFDEDTTITKIVQNFVHCDCTANSSNHLSTCRRRKFSQRLDPETPVKRPRLSSTNSIPPSPWEQRQMKAELIEARARNISLENQIQQLHTVRKELEFAFESEKQSLRGQQIWDRQKINDLESRLAAIRKREVETNADLADTKCKLNAKIIRLQSEIEKLNQTISEMRDERFEKSAKEERANESMNHQIGTLTTTLTAAEDDLKAQKQLVAELQSQLSEVKALNREYEIKDNSNQRMLLRLKELEFERGNYLEWQQQSKMLHQKIQNYREMEKEVEHLREQNKHLVEGVQNKLLLEEQIVDLNKRLELYKNLQNDLIQSEGKYSEMESLLNKWNSVAKEFTDFTGPDTLLPDQMKKAVVELQQKEVVLTSEKKALESELRTSQREVTTLTQKSEKMNKHIVDLEASHKRQQVLVHRLQKKLLLVSRERDSYRTQLDSYEKELTISIPSSSGQTLAGNQKERLEFCEKLIEDYKEHISKLEAELEQNSSQNISVVSTPIYAEKIKRLETELNDLRVENSDLIKQRNNLQDRYERLVLNEESERVQSLKSEIRQLKFELDELTTKYKDVVSQLNAREQDEPSTSSAGKVLHLRMNPFDEARTKFETDMQVLQNENEKLRKRITKLEEGMDCTKTETAYPSQVELQLREKIKSLELKTVRLKEVFASTSQTFRDVCYMLLGYKIDRLDSNNYRLLSQYAQSPEDFLLFHVTDEGHVNLIETDFSTQIKDLIDENLHVYQSFPLFLGTLTSDLFKRSTHVGS